MYTLQDYIVVMLYIYFRYYYTQRSSTDQWPSYTGVKHGDELEFTFGHPITNLTGNYPEDEAQLSEYIVDYWLNFVIDGYVKFISIYITSQVTKLICLSVSLFVN